MEERVRPFADIVITDGTSTLYPWQAVVEILTLFAPRTIMILSIKVANEGQFNWLNPHFESPTET